MKLSPGWILLCAGFLAGLSCGLRAQDQDAAQPQYQVQPQPQQPQDVAAPPANYVPQQYIPLYTPAPGTEVSPADAGAVAAKAVPDEAPPDVLPLVGFRSPTVFPRVDGAQPGFAPLVSATPPSDRERQLLNSDKGVPRIYAPGFRLGPFDVRPDLRTQGTYNDNIYLVSKSVPRTTDYIISVSPRVDITYANGTIADPDATQFDLFYAPTLLQFIQTPGNSSLNQDVYASLGHRFTKLRVALTQAYSHTSGGIIQAGDLIDQDLYNTSLDVSYDLTPKVTTELTSSYGVSRYSLGVGSNDLRSSLFVNYLARPKLILSVAPYSDYLTTQGSSNDQWAVGGTARADYIYSDQTVFYAQLGAGERWYDASPLTSQEWTYSLGANWQADAKTSVSVNAMRQTNGSALSVNSDYVDSSFGVTLSKTLVDTISASLTGSYNHADYYSTLDGTPQQTFDYFSISPGIAYHPTIWCDLGMIYSYRQNFSAIKASEFTNNQISIFSTLRF